MQLAGTFGPDSDRGAADMFTSCTATRPVGLRAQATRPRHVARAQPSNPNYDNEGRDIVKERRKESKERLNHPDEEATKAAPGWMKDGNSNDGNLAKDLADEAKKMADKVTGKE